MDFKSQLNVQDHETIFFKTETKKTKLRLFKNPPDFEDLILIKIFEIYLKSNLLTSSTFMAPPKTIIFQTRLMF